jgi:PAS domain-containing protein
MVRSIALPQGGGMADETDDTSGEAPDLAQLLESLRLGEARLHGVLNSISDGFYAIDRDWRITEVNPAAKAYFRMPRAEVIGRNYWDLVIAAPAALIYQIVTRSAGGR